MKNYFRLLLLFTVLMISPQITFADNPEKPTIEILQLDDNELVSFRNNFVDLSIENSTHIYLDEATPIDMDKLAELMYQKSNRLLTLDEFKELQILRHEQRSIQTFFPQDKFDRINQLTNKMFSKSNNYLEPENQLDKILQSVPNEMDLSEFEFVLNKTEFDKISHLVQDNTYKNIPVRVLNEAPEKNIYLMPKSNSKYF